MFSIIHPNDEPQSVIPNIVVKNNHQLNPKENTDYLIDCVNLLAFNNQ